MLGRDECIGQRRPGWPGPTAGLQRMLDVCGDAPIRSWSLSSPMEVIPMVGFERELSVDSRRRTGARGVAIREAGPGKG